MADNINCESCYSCNYCSYCNYCYSCNYCKNIKMTEYNYFCYAEDMNKDWFQQPRYRVFNKEISKEEYFKINKIYKRLEFDLNESYKKRFETAFKKMWNWLDREGKQKYLDIPYFNAEIFKKITWIDVEKETEEMTLEQLCKELWREVKIIK